MQIEEFSLERIQSLYENLVALNLSDSGVHPLSLRELLSEAEREALLDLELGYGWTNGAVALREAVAALYADRDAAQVMITNGSAEANFALATSLVNAGDEVIVVVPNYMQIAGWARAIGATVRSVPLRESAAGWTLDPAEVAAAISPRTRLITLCTPNNPTGAVLPDEVLRELAALAETHGVWLHADEVYSGSEFAAKPSASMADLTGRAIVTNGLSKAMALPGLRIGWLVGPAELMAGVWAVKDYTSITTSAISEYVATLLLAPARRATILARSRELLSANLQVLSAWVDSQPAFSMTAPQGGGMAFLRYALAINSTELATMLRERDSLLVLPGDVFGMDGFLRIGTGGTADELREGLSRLARRVATLQG